jgi:DNA polymerase elongation subunit (family B)
LSYIDGYLDREKDVIKIVGRVNGERVFSEFKPDYSFYISDKKGKFTTVYGTPVSKVSPRSGKEFQKEKAVNSHNECWESDLNLVFKCLSQNFRNVPSPKLNVAFVDIESDFDPELGFAPPENPFTKITAITTILQWTGQCITFAMPPKGMSLQAANEIADRFDNTYIFTDEVEMLNAFLDLIQEADIISGWNSEGYDLPFIINRVIRLMSKNDARRMCLWDIMPKTKTYERFGSEHETYELVGRLHLDYMQLYRKYTFEERHSYSLNAIGEYELNETKTPYEGSLDALYNQDFAKFIEYNRQDVFLIDKLDKKLKFIELANEAAHQNTVLIPAQMGTVAPTEQAIVNRAHDLGLVVPNRKRSFGDSDNGEGFDSAAGAYVAYPKKGMHMWLGSIDINGLYPSAIMALNMAPETIVGQVRQDFTNKIIRDRMASGKSFADSWENEFGCREYQAIMRQDKGFEIVIDWEHSNKSDTMTAEEAFKLIFASDQPWCISGNGTIFTYEKEGIIPGLLDFWKKDRKRLQKMKADSIDIKGGIEVPSDILDELNSLLQG